MSPIHLHGFTAQQKKKKLTSIFLDPPPSVGYKGVYSHGNKGHFCGSATAGLRVPERHRDMIDRAELQAGVSHTPGTVPSALRALAASHPNPLSISQVKKLRR